MYKQNYNPEPKGLCLTTAILILEHETIFNILIKEDMENIQFPCHLILKLHFYIRAARLIAKRSQSRSKHPCDFIPFMSFKPLK